ncbi:MAG: dihydropyrimidinase [Bacteroidales bacterium]|nr:dihydropyrimidinase [Bacteroidales bacterium]
MAVLVSNAFIVNAEESFHADILIEDDKVKSIAKGIRADSRKELIHLDASGKIVMPGGVDPHVHMQLPTGAGYSSDDFLTGSRAALKGGTTTLIDFVTPKRGQSLTEALAGRKKEATNCLTDYSFHISPVEWRSTTADEIRECISMGYRSFKIYMAYKDSIGVGGEVIENVMRVIAGSGALVIMHCETGDEIEEMRQQLANQGKLSPASHPLSRPPHTESRAVEQAIRLAGKTGCPLYIVHVSTAESVELIRKARMAGQQVMGEACPHHLLLDESLYDKPFEESAPYVMSPPLRSRRHRDALWQGLKDGTLQTVGTDHCPFLMKQKALGRHDFRKIANGAGGVEHRLSLLYTYGVLREKISLQELVKLCSTNPAKIFGLYPKKGVIAEGADADLVIWDPKKQQTISAKSHHQNCDHNIYEGFKTTGYPEQVILKGRLL